MKNESVAILDIRSGEINFSLGAKGVNDTFFFNNSHSLPYEGFLVEGFLDDGSFRKAVMQTVTSVRQSYGGTIETVYVGVPSAFVSVWTKGHTLSFPSKRRVTSQDVDYLYESGQSELLLSGKCIRRSNMYYSLGDNRKYFSVEELYGTSTTSLKGALCYYTVSDSFYQQVKGVLIELGVEDVRFIPSTLAQAVYLLPQKRREGYAFLLDIGFLTSSITVVYGNGIVREETFNCGMGTVLVSLMEHFGIDYTTAEEILAASNISGGGIPEDLTWSNMQGDQQFKVREINEVIKCSLDVLCEQADEFLSKHYSEKNATVLSTNPICLTGEGVSGIKGVAEHVSRRLSRLTEIVVPELPYFDKPSFSSRIALLDMAISDGKKKGWLQRIFSVFGGRKK